MDSSAFITWCEDFFKQQTQNKSLSLVMGILNVTPDSFSDGGCYLKTQDALRHAEALIAAGADVIDIGGESSRPGALPVALDEELRRVIPVIEGIRKYHSIAISIDTYKPDVMRLAVAAGATFINDIYALQAPGALEVVKQLQVPVCLMHMRGSPRNMQDAPVYEQGVVAAIQNFFAERIQACLLAGLSRNYLMLDPGFGFGKTVEDNLRLTNQLALFQMHQLPLVFGASKKHTIGVLLNKPAAERSVGSLALATYAKLQGANIIRTHDVRATRDALQVVDAVANLNT